MEGTKQITVKTCDEVVFSEYIEIKHPCRKILSHLLPFFNEGFVKENLG